MQTLQDSDAEGYIDVDNTVLTPSPQRIRNILTLEERVAAIKAYQQRPMYTKVARMFNCSWEQIKNIITNRDAIMEFYEATKSHRDLNKDEDQFPDQHLNKLKFLGECVYEYIQRIQFYQKIPISEELLRVKAMEFQDIIKCDNFTPNRAWLNLFKTKFNITLSSKEVVLTRVPPPSLDLTDIMTYCTKNRNPSMEFNSLHLKDLKQKYNSFDAKTAEYESRRVRKLNFLQRALNEYLHRANFHHKSLSLDDEAVQKVAESFNDILKVQDFYPTLEWIRLFKHRHSLKETKENKNKRPLLSLDLKDILSYCGRMDNKLHPCTVTLTPKHTAVVQHTYMMPKFPAVGDSNLKFQQNPIIYLDDGDETVNDIKPDMEELNHKRLRIADVLAPLKIRKIESINNDPVLQKQLQHQEQQQEHQQHEHHHNNGSIPNLNELEEELANKNEQKMYIKQEMFIKTEAQEEEEMQDITISQQPPQAIGRINTLSSVPPHISNYNVKLTTGCQTNHTVIKSNICLNEKSNIPTPTGSRDSSWQVSSFEDALRFLKPLEEYAMLAENYRAIGLISQLEEVLKQQSLSK